MRVYTRTGDGGETGLVGGSRVSKACSTIGVVGDLDELNSCLGLARAAGLEGSMDKTLARAQNRIFDIGAEVANPVASGGVSLEAEIRALESEMDAMTADLPALRKFILPGGTEQAARLHVARSTCRRAERSLVAEASQRSIRPELIQYVNRLSDWLFVAARAANHHAGQPDIVWEKG